MRKLAGWHLGWPWNGARISSRIRDSVRPTSWACSGWLARTLSSTRVRTPGQGAGTQDPRDQLVGDDQPQRGRGQDRLSGRRRGGQPVVGPVQQAGQLLGADAAVGEQQVRVGRADGFRRGGFVLDDVHLVEGRPSTCDSRMSSVRETARWSRSSSRSSR
jgi:hypothetical protein